MLRLRAAFVTAVAVGLGVGCRSASAQPSAPTESASDASALQTATFHVEGMACERCSGRLRAVLLRLDGVVAADADHKAKQVVVRFDPNRVSMERIKQEIERAGFQVV